VQPVVPGRRIGRPWPSMAAGGDVLEALVGEQRVGGGTTRGPSVSLAVLIAADAMSLMGL
jgi:hypothetical protein